MKRLVEQASFSHSGTHTRFEEDDFFFLILSTVRTGSCADMENIQAINASMPAQCQAGQRSSGGPILSPTIAKSGIQ